jgi:hypothetical protein
VSSRAPRATVGGCARTLIPRPPASGTHLALVEESWFEVKFRGLKPREDFAGVDRDADPDYEFRTALDQDPDWLRRRYAGRSCT